VAKLIYSAIASLDGYVADARGNFDWAAPDEEVHRFINDLERPIGTYLFGRRMYEVMKYWDTPDAAGDPSQVIREFAGIWQAAEKIVYSRSLASISTRRTSLESSFDPDAVRRLKSNARADIAVGGPHLAAEAFKADLVDECLQFVVPVTVGTGNAAFPSDVRLQLALRDEHRFESGVVYLRYDVVTGRGRA
jgi:dihydrofolate reductase